MAATAGVGVLEHVRGDAAAAQALAAQGGDEVLREDVDHDPAHGAGDDADRDDRQRQRAGSTMKRMCSMSQAQFCELELPAPMAGSSMSLTLKITTSSMPSQ